MKTDSNSQQIKQAIHTARIAWRGYWKNGSETAYTLAITSIAKARLLSGDVLAVPSLAGRFPIPKAKAKSVRDDSLTPRIDSREVYESDYRDYTNELHPSDFDSFEHDSRGGIIRFNHSDCIPDNPDETLDAVEKAIESAIRDSRINEI